MIKRCVVLVLSFLLSFAIMSCNSNHVADKPDKTKPTILSTSPANNATAVVVTTAVTVTFSEAMNASTINDTSFLLVSVVSGSTTTIAGKVTYDSSSHVATFTTTTTLDYNTTYKATITSKVTDAAGNSLGSSESWSFKTAPPPGTIDFRVVEQLVSGDSVAYAAAIQQDGKIITAGLSGSGTYYFTIARFLSATGTRDIYFGLNGKADYFTGTARSVGLQPDGMIVAAGSNESNPSSSADFTIARYDTYGVLDAGFGSNGKVIVDMGYWRDVINSMAIQPSDGKIVVAGDGTDDGITYVSIISRYTTTGILDVSFASNGTTTYTVGTTSQTPVLKIQPGDGKIVVGGSFQDGSGLKSIYLSRLKSDGTPDTLFSGGTVTASPGTNPVLSDIAILANGQILVAGTTNSGTTTNDDIFLMLYNTDGNLDTTFGTGGIVFTDDGSYGVETAEGLAVQQDGKIIVAATFHPTTGGTLTNDFAVFRYNADGTLDTTFGNGHGMGIAAFSQNGTNYDAFAEDVQIQQDGKIVVVGAISINSNYDLGLARFWP